MMILGAGIFDASRMKSTFNATVCKSSVSETKDFSSV